MASVNVHDAYKDIQALRESLGTFDSKCICSRSHPGSKLGLTYSLASMVHQHAIFV
jgi:hypothetical protein